MFQRLRKLFWVGLGALIILAGGCVPQTTSRTGIDTSLFPQENIQKVAVLTFESPLMDPEAGPHISNLFEVNLQQLSVYKIAERAEIEKVLREKGLPLSPSLSAGAIRQIGDLLKVDGVILGAVSQYGRFDMAFTARLVSTKTGMVLWTVAQTGGRFFLPISKVADETVRAAVLDLVKTMK